MKRKSRIGISLLALSMLCTQTTSLSVYAKNNIEPGQQYKLSSLEQAKKNLADFEAKYAKELAQLKQGSKGYFDSIGVGESIDCIFDKNSSSPAEAGLASYTNMGQKDDATSLENMQASIAYLKECNEIRKKEGLPELKVSTWLTAIAQVNANHAKSNMEHAGVYATGENLAWGYGNANTAGSPFRGWYDEEKAEYLAGNHKFSETGHYQNIVEKENTVTGFAIGTNGSYGTVHCQEFLDEVTDVNYEVQMTVSEFEKSFNSYYNKLKSIDSQHKALQKAVEAQSGKWIQTNKKWWYKHKNGSYTRNDFEYIDGHWYYFDSNGYMITGWKQVGSNWYYFTGSGIMASSQWMGNYYFEENGAMATNKWIGNYHVGANGKWDMTR
ncbi:N-acetylmuramoyl-L-alanine amidase family protein [uncultured Holdemanella sp.]|uniref:N-acetylmuramoyl-L-alanine amidase family protein n=1 Tax=uncultured Holdemanella sp. TaxID=1763549 RepID=UPI0025CE64A4|nr:CAP domain-containing protein [uncultured Holdemanella sp.]